MQRDTDKDWKGLAEQNPYHAVLTDQRWSEQINDEKIREFMGTGANYIRDAVSQLKLLGDFSPTRSLDFGCGVGRLMAHMAAHCKHVTGVDVSPVMLNEARQNLNALRVRDYDLIEANGLSGLKDQQARFDWINSYIVMQHIPQSRGYEIFSDMLSLLNPGGFFSVQFTIATEMRHVGKKLGSHLYAVSDGEHVRLLSGRADDLQAPKMSMHDYDLTNIMLILAEAQIMRTLLKHTNHQGHVGVMIFGRKPL